MRERNIGNPQFGHGRSSIGADVASERRSSVLRGRGCWTSQPPLASAPGELSLPGGSPSDAMCLLTHRSKIFEPLFCRSDPLDSEVPLFPPVWNEFVQYRLGGQ